MDALVQTREAQRTPETAAQFLTTFMLPKLTELHDHGRVIFFMATNFRDRFDPAITRPGRFDLLLCVGPPSLKEKLNRFAVFTNEKAIDVTRSADAFQKLLEPNPTTALQLHLYTFDEFRGFIRSLKAEKPFTESFGSMKPEELKQQVDADSESVTLKLRELSDLSKIKIQIQSIEDLQKMPFVERREVDANKIEVTQAIRYLMDRRVSRVRML